MDMRELPEYLTVAEVSDLLRVSEGTLRIWIDEGRVPAVQIGRQWRIPRRRLEETLDAAAVHGEQAGGLWDRGAVGGGDGGGEDAA